MTKTILLVAAAFALGSVAVAADWPQWRGPNRDEISKETGLLKSWPKDGPKLLWTFREAGLGFATPSVVGDRLYSQGGDGDKEFVFAVDLKNHKKLWSTEVGAFYENSYGDGPRGTPTVDGNLIYALGGQGSLLCVKADTGEKVWSKSMQKDFGGTQPWWGYTESPLVDGDQLVVTPGGAKGAIVALNKKNGELIWQSGEFKDGAMYSSLVVADAAGARQYIQMTGEHIVGVDPKDGHVLWSFARKGPTAAIPTPVVSGDYVFVTSGYSAGCNLLKLSKAGDKIQVSEVYKEDEDYKRMSNHHGGVVLLDGHVYGYSDGKHHAGPAAWICQELKTGNVVWAENKALGKGSLTYADGRLYCYGEDDGACVLAEATPRGWKETGRLKIEKTKTTHNGKVWPHPVVANGKLYLRDQDLIHCYDVKDGT
jgi:outer membrane protein assembly factor BamB